MSAFDYNKSAATALRLITKFGQTVTITRQTNTVSGSDGSVSQSASTGSVKLVTVPASKGDIDKADNMLKEGLINGKARFAIVAALNAGLIPTINDTLPLGGDTFRILGVTPLDPAGTPIIYKMGMLKV